MSQPTALARLVRYADYAAANTAQPYNSSQHDAEHDAIVNTMTQVLANIALIQRDDGGIRNGTVTPSALSADLLVLIGSTGINWRGNWAIVTAYALKDAVVFNGASYVSLVAHTSSGDFNVDLAAGNWQIISNTASAVAIAFTPTASILSSNIQNAIQEVDAKVSSIIGFNRSYAFQTF
jgi:hypothetical protein